ncbi:MAG: type II toxin-antitoxin system HigB family toxin [Phycisphaerales bacterium]|nr:type II toxin-antitoxin system HigB family toxin [Phycisphaerales bacterium]
MHIISRKALKVFAAIHPDADAALDAWYRTANKAQWQSIMDVRQSFPHADVAKVASGRIVTIFNICGNKYRLIADIHYNRSKIYTLKVMSHKEYCLNRWKETL